jgi:GMP synthase-like glutamine amidotransferase
MHGKTSRIEHEGTGIFTGVPSPLRVARYHSLVIAPDRLPSSLRVLARALDDGAIMAVAHREHPVIGVQFHPESAATHHGYALIERFLYGEAARLDGLPSRADGAGDDLGRPVWGVPDDERAPFVPPSVQHVR